MVFLSFRIVCAVRQEGKRNDGSMLTAKRVAFHFESIGMKCASREMHKLTIKSITLRYGAIKGEKDQAKGSHSQMASIATAEEGGRNEGIEQQQQQPAKQIKTNSNFRDKLMRNTNTHTPTSNPIHETDPLWMYLSNKHGASSAISIGDCVIFFSSFEWLQINGEDNIRVRTSIDAARRSSERKRQGQKSPLLIILIMRFLNSA